MFLQEHESAQEETFLDYDFNDTSSDKPLTRAQAKLINLKKRYTTGIINAKRGRWI
jgi:hypothetical protein